MSVVGDFFSAWELAMNARDAAGVSSLCTEDVVWEDSVLMGRGPLHGRVAVRDFLEEYLFHPLPDLRFEILELIESNDGRPRHPGHPGYRPAGGGSSASGDDR
jgi:ketosteroid isomerase-like protein